MRRSWLFRLWRNRSGAAGLLLIVLFLAAALAGALGLTPYPPNQQHAKDRMQPPSRQYVFGTDEFGRDVYSRLIRRDQFAEHRVRLGCVGQRRRRDARHTGRLLRRTDG